MYHVMAIANYEDRFVIPSTHREYAENTFDVRGGCGFSFGNGCSDGASEDQSVWRQQDAAPFPSRRRSEPWHFFKHRSQPHQACACWRACCPTLMPHAAQRPGRHAPGPAHRESLRRPAASWKTDRLRLTKHLARSNALDIDEAEYVELFDRGRATSLHLFEHVHGDSRDRGPAMIDLAQTYEKAGLFLGPDEMPDYLPVVLEFVSTQPPKEARAFLSEMAHIFNAIFNALQQRNSPLRQCAGRAAGARGEKAHPVKVVPDEPLDDQLGRTGGV